MSYAPIFRPSPRAAALQSDRVDTFCTLLVDLGRPMFLTQMALYMCFAKLRITFLDGTLMLAAIDILALFQDLTRLVYEISPGLTHFHLLPNSV